MDAVVRNLLFLYAGLLLMNSVLTAMLWAKNRSALFAALFFTWLTTLVSLVAQGALQQTPLLIVLGFGTAFGVNLSLAYLLGRAVDVDVRWRPFVALLVAGFATSVTASFAGAPFWGIALPVAVSVSLPSAVTSSWVLRSRWGQLTVAGKALAVSTLLFAAHNVDFAFLRDKPSFAPLGFTIAILIVFALSMTGPAVALEVATERQARISAELEAARRIQTSILPRQLQLPGLDVVGYMQQADSVGGDYFDVHRVGEEGWLLLGDVTGHGLGAGLVMLMAQSTLSAIVQARPDISPRELNHLANRVLRSNLARLDERRHMTIVSIRCHGSRFAISGSHDDVYLWRSRTGRVEAVPVAHFPFGIGMLDFEPSEVGEDALRMERGDLLFVGTDGVVEAAREGDPRQGIFGAEGISDVLSSNSAAPLEQIKRKLLARLQEFTRGIYLDDVAFLIVRATGIEKGGDA
jgi:serine phosphatase RsbU (regulator of sigma subunit)